MLRLLAPRVGAWKAVGVMTALIAGLVGQLASAQMREPASAEQLALGRSIYANGIGQSGKPLVALRKGKQVAADAIACSSCHRPSGMGQVEADVQIPPIAGVFLYATPADKRYVNMDPRVSKFFNQAHEPYTDETLAKAIREGVNNSGRTMNTVMPHFDLNDTELAAVIAYLNQLSQHLSPGATDDHIHFATVITPDVDPARRKVFSDMVKSIVHQKNGSTVTATLHQNRTRHHMVSAAEMTLGTERTWDIDIWELQGEPQTWAAQLDTLYAKNPPFAILSGVSKSTWQPVQDFCDRQKVPCWFPSVPAPEKSFSPYAFYFSAGVHLEASVLARHLRDQKQTTGRVLQYYREGDVGAAAAADLKAALADTKLDVRLQALPATGDLAAGLKKLQKDVRSGDTVMFWLRAEDLGALADTKPPAANIYFSSEMMRAADTALPDAWKEKASVVYLYDLPSHRKRNLDYFNVWVNSKKIPVVDLAMQSEVFFAFNFMSDTLADMLNNVYRDYLVERGETMLSQREGTKAEQETRDRVFLGREGDLVRKKGFYYTVDDAVRVQLPDQAEGTAPNHGTTLYATLSLAPGQRFASKGATIVRLGSGVDVQAVSPFIIP